MANWGLLMGLGQGLQQAGGMINEHNKSKLAEKLKIDAENRAAAREKAKFDREQLSYDKTVPELNSDGIWMNVKYAKNGNRMDSTIAPPDVQKAMTAAAEAEALKLKKDTLTVDTLEKQLANFDADADLERRYKESIIDRNRDTGLAAVMRANSSSSDTKPPHSMSEAADVLVDNYTDLVKQVTTAPTGQEPLLTPAEVRRVATESVKIAAARGQDAAAIFQDALRIRANGARRDRSLELDLGR